MNKTYKILVTLITLTFSCCNKSIYYGPAQYSPATVVAVSDHFIAVDTGFAKMYSERISGDFEVGDIVDVDFRPAFLECGNQSILLTHEILDINK